MSNTYIIKLNIEKEGKHLFSYMAANNGYLVRFRDPMGFNEYLTREQAEKIAAQYSAWWKENVTSQVLESIRILSLEESINEYYEWMKRRLSKAKTASDIIIRRTERDFPAKRITEIPVII